MAPVRGQWYPAMSRSAQRRTEAQRQAVRAALLAEPWRATVDIMAAGHSPGTVVAVRRAMIAARQIHKYGGRARHSNSCWCTAAPLVPCPAGMITPAVVFAFVRQRVTVQDAYEQRARDLLGPVSQSHLLDAAALIWRGWLPSREPRRRVGTNAPGGSEHAPGGHRIAADATGQRRLGIRMDTASARLRAAQRPGSTASVTTHGERGVLVSPRNESGARRRARRKTARTCLLCGEPVTEDDRVKLGNGAAHVTCLADQASAWYRDGPTGRRGTTRSQRTGGPAVN
jgi:hypothetical protein